MKRGRPSGSTATCTSEVCGSSVALAIAEDILAIHQGAHEAGGKAFPAHMAEAIRDTLFYVVPRISPDGAEEVLKRALDVNVGSCRVGYRTVDVAVG